MTRQRRTDTTAGDGPAAPAAVRVAIYLRISTDEEHQPFSLDAQRHRLTSFIPTQPAWTHVATYEDQMSGAKATRPALDRALADARAGRFDVLLVYRVDRFARSLKVLVGLLEELDSAGVAFRSATEPIDTSTATGRMLVQLLGVFAEFERATIIDRVINGMERKAARGGWPGGPLPYGLALDEAGKLCSAEGMAVVERIFARYASGEVGAAALAAELNADGFVTRMGRPWSAKVVLDVLRNRTYLGEVHFRGTWHPSAEAPFIAPETFDAVQALLDKRGESYRQRFTVRRPEYLLTGLVRCSRCQRRYVGVAGTGKRHRYRYYMCWTRSRYGPGACDAERLRADELEEAVLAALVETYGHPGLLRQSCAGHQAVARQGVEVHRREIAVLDVELAKAEAAVERYMLAFENGSLTEAAFGPRVRELGAQAELLRARREQATSALTEPNGPRCQLSGTCGRYTGCCWRPSARATTRCESPSPRPSSPSCWSKVETAFCRASGCSPSYPTERRRSIVARLTQRQVFVQ